MTIVKFFSNGGKLTGFSIKGHSSDNAKDQTGKLVCAAVSSAAYLVANTITEVIGEDADISVSDALMQLTVSDPNEQTSAILSGFKLHMEQLSAQYSSKIKLTMEV